MKANLEVSITVIHWGLFMGLCTLSILSVWEVYEKFQSKDSSFTQYEEPITQHPTTVMCFSPPFKNRTDPDMHLLMEKQFEIGIDFNISISDHGDKIYNWTNGMNHLVKDGKYNIKSLGRYKIPDNHKCQINFPILNLYCTIFKFQTH